MCRTLAAIRAGADPYRADDAEVLRTADGLAGPAAGARSAYGRRRDASTRDRRRRLHRHPRRAALVGRRPRGVHRGRRPPGRAPRGRCRPRGRSPGDRADLRDPAAVAAALRGVDVGGAPGRAWSGIGVDLDDLPEYVGCNDLGTAVLLAAMARAGRAPAGAGQLDGGLRRGRVRLRRARPGAARRPRRRRPGRRPVRAAPARAAATPLAPAPGRRGRRRLDPRSVYAATKVAQEHLAAAWARQTGGSVVALRYHNVYGPGMPARHARTAGSRRSSGPRWRPAARRGCSRTAASGATSCTSATWRRPTSPPRSGRRRATGLAGVQRRLRARRRPCGEMAAALAAGDGRPGAGGDRRVPARRRAARGRLAGPRGRRTRLPRRDRPRRRAWPSSRRAACADERTADRGPDPPAGPT